MNGFHVVVGAQFEARGDAVDLVDRGDHHDRKVLPPRVALDRAQHRDAIHLRHHDVEKDDVERVAAKHAQGLTSALGHQHRVPLVHQPAPQQLAIVGVVVDDEDGAAACGGRRQSPLSVTTLSDNTSITRLSGSALSAAGFSAGALSASAAEESGPPTCQ